MSRLDSVIRRLCAQRDCLNAAVSAAPEGAFLEIGLGNGRTYNHLREIAPDREIWVIDRAMNAHPASAPPDALFLCGEADEMMTTLHERIGRTIALAHYDLGVGIPEHDTPLRARLAPLLRQLMTDKALLVANARFDLFDTIPTPETVPTDRYFMHRVEG